MLFRSDITSWFKVIVLCGLHDNSRLPCDDYPGSHYHVLGEAKMSNRHIRDMSIERLKNMGIIGGQEAKDSWLAGRQRHIIDPGHFKNTIEYIKRQCQVITIDNTANYSFPKTSIFKIIDDVITPEEVAVEEMMEFRQRYPKKDSLTKRKLSNQSERGHFFKHYMVMSTLQTDITSWFKVIVLCGLHDNSRLPCDDYPGSHYHVLGEAKMSNRHIRDMSIERLKNMGIIGGQEAKDSWLAGRQRHIIDPGHFKNTIEYIKRQCQVITIDNTANYSFPKTSIFKIIDDVITPEEVAIVGEEKKKKDIIENYIG